MKLRLLGLLLLLPAVYCGGKLAGNYLDEAMSANRDKPPRTKMVQSPDLPASQVRKSTPWTASFSLHSC